MFSIPAHPQLDGLLWAAVKISIAMKKLDFSSQHGSDIQPLLQNPKYF